MEKSCIEQILETISNISRTDLSDVDKASIINTLERQKKWTYYPNLPENLTIGKHSYYGRFFTCSNNVTIGKYCSIADFVSIGLGKHPTDMLSTHPFIYINDERYNIGNIPLSYDAHPKTVIGNDVWIGFGAKIMDGITINDGAIIGTGAVVTKDVPAYAIVAGIPAKLLRYRFPQNIIDELLELKWWDIPEEVIAKLKWNDINSCISDIKKYRMSKI